MNLPPYLNNVRGTENAAETITFIGTYHLKDLTPRSLVEVCRRLGDDYCLHFQGRRINQGSLLQATLSYFSTLKMEAVFSTKQKNSKFLLGCTGSHSRRQYSTLRLLSKSNFDTNYYRNNRCSFWKGNKSKK